MKLHLPIAVCLALALCMSAGGQLVKVKDSSDWWSITGGNFHSPELKSQSKEINPGNFEILGTHFRTNGFKGVTAKLGKASIVQRGDGDTGRQQVCYVAPKQNPTIHLVFEFGETDSIFYLFTGGADWKGSNYCVASTRVLADLSTASGLRLGLTPQQVEAILGRPDTTVGDTEFYLREFHRRSTPAQFEEQRKEYPDQLSDAVAHEKFDFCPVEQYIVTKFANSRLTYLAVSTDEE